MYLVPLQYPFCGSRYRKSMMGLPTFIKMCVGNPDGVSLFMNSTGYSLSLCTVSQLLYFIASPGNLSIIILFISSNTLLVGAIVTSFTWQEALEFD